MKFNIAIIGSAINYANWIAFPRDVICITSKKELLKEEILNSLDLAIFTGGEDVNPKLYHMSAHPTTRYSDTRDEFEQFCYEILMEAGIPMLGICRGAQFLTVMSGGSLIQNVTNHALMGKHDLYFKNAQLNERLLGSTTSTHHQMMYPFDTNHELFAYAKPVSTEYALSDRIMLEELPTPTEPEIVYYNTALAVQGHPEYMSKSSFLVYFLNYYLAYSCQVLKDPVCQSYFQSMPELTAPQIEFLSWTSRFLYTRPHHSTYQFTNTNVIPKKNKELNDNL